MNLNLIEITDDKEDSFYDNNLLSSPEMKKVIATKKLPERLILLVFSFRNQKRIEVAVVFSKSSDQGLIRSLSVVDRKQQDKKFCKTDFLARFMYHISTFLQMQTLQIPSGQDH